MKKPKKVAVGHVVYDIREEDRLSEITGTSGTCGQDVQVILIDTQLGPDQERETVLHELLHAIFYATSASKMLEELEKVADVKDLEERFIQPVAGRLLEVLRDNPGLVEYLVAE